MSLRPVSEAHEHMLAAFALLKDSVGPVFAEEIVAVMVQANANKSLAKKTPLC